MTSPLLDPQIEKALDVIRSGALGEIVSVDILRGAEYPPYEGGPLPPWYRDAAYPFRDIGADCMSLLRELLGPIKSVDAHWSSLGGDPNLAFDEWRCQVGCERGLGQFQLTWNVKPMQSELIIHGTRGVRRVDLSALFHGRKATPLDRILGAFSESSELAAGTPPAVTADHPADVVDWVDKVARAANLDHETKLAKFKLGDTVPYLVTGAAGSLGRATVDRLLGQGHRVRVFVRRIPTTPIAGVEYAFGNLGDPVAVDRAVKGAEKVIHIGAATKGDWLAHRCGTVIGTQNVLDACTKHAARQLIYLSSMSVIDWAGSEGISAVDESVALEPRAEERGAYTRAKLEAELRVTAAAANGLPTVILRPGQIFGGGIPLINGAVARNAGGRWLVLGDGTLELPLVYIDDVVDAIIAADHKNLTSGEIIQLIDPDTLTQEDVLALAGNGKQVLRIPRLIVFALGKLSELPLKALNKPSPIARYRMKSALSRMHYHSDRAHTLLGWTPRVGVREGIKRVMAV